MLDSMNVSSYVNDFSFSSASHILWRYYLEYLWHYESSSWVAKTASTVRVLAFLLIMPVAILGMLDISAYVIARTLGVVEVVKASTNDKAVTQKPAPPPIIIEDMSSTPNLTDSTLSTTDESVTPPSDHTYLTLEERNGLGELASMDASLFSNEKLSGVGVFSPATSRPPSPTISRRQLHRESKGQGVDMDISSGDEGLSLRRRPRRNTGAGIE